MKTSMEGICVKNLSWYISLGVSFLGFMVINYYFTLDPTEKVGNLNPAFFLIVLLVPFLCVSLFITWSVGVSFFETATKGKLALALLIMVVIFILAGGTEYQYVTSQIEVFGGTWNDPKSIIYGRSPFNSYTNDWYFNESVFLIIHTIAFSLGSLFRSKVTD